jgi:cellulose synthase/poly-beta-1,6-N-acetylglucosamine synthase-like glycosyltransferase
MTALLTWLYVAATAGLSFYGLFGLVTLWLYRRHRFDGDPVACIPADGRWPRVTVQLPLYNERCVVGALIDAVAALDYPADLLQIQVIDDSTDETTALAAERVDHYRRLGQDIALLHRPQRAGYKAGGLAAALPRATGELIVLFDADFRPPPDFLRRTVPHFLADPRLGVVQARWGHLNAACSPLTAAQAIALDKHFAIEQVVRHRADLFPKFNGTAGVWRRSCLEDAGGWSDETLCEDLCLSTRASLRGWRFSYLNDVVAPAQLPAGIIAYKSQQARWAEGSFQCLRQYGPAILATDRHRLAAKLYALVSMSAYFTHPLLLALLLLQVPMLWLGATLPPWITLFGLAGIFQPILFVLGQWALYPNWRARLRHLPALLLVAVGTAPSNSWAMLRRLLSPGTRRPFQRTPKQAHDPGSLTGHPADDAPPLPLMATNSYRLSAGAMVWVELGLALYAGLGIALALARASYGPLTLLVIAVAGLGYVAFLGLRETVSVGHDLPTATD